MDTQSKLVANRRLRFEIDTVSIIKRVLEGRGTIRVKVGQEVTPEEIVGSSISSGGFRVLDLSNLLSVPPNQVKKYLQRPLGHKIYRGELLALKRGGFWQNQKLIISPTDGVLDFLDEQTGQLRLTFLPKHIDLPAAVYGIVEKVNPPLGEIVIKTQVTRIYGLFGSGKARDGILRTLGGRGDLIHEYNISATRTENILVGGSLIYKEAMAWAITSEISGIITGGINAEDFRGISGGRLKFSNEANSTDIGTSIIVCEGFGSIPIGSDIFDILLKHNSRFAIIDGHKATISLPSFESSSMIKVRKTALPSSAQEPKTGNLLDVSDIEMGQKVRIIGSPYMGEQGKVISLDKTETLLATGIWSYLIGVETRSKKIKVPYLNLEII